MQRFDSSQTRQSQTQALPWRHDRCVLGCTGTPANQTWRCIKKLITYCTKTKDTGNRASVSPGGFHFGSLPPAGLELSAGLDRGGVVGVFTPETEAAGLRLIVEVEAVRKGQVLEDNSRYTLLTE